MSKLMFKVVPPIDELKRDVLNIRITRYSGDDPLKIKVVPRGLPGMVFSITDTGETAISSISTRSYVNAELPHFFMFGQGTEPSIMEFKGNPYTTIQVAFKPSALSTIFDMNISAIDKGWWTAKEINAQKLEADLLREKDTAKQINLISDFLSNQLTQHGKRDLLVEKVVTNIDSNITDVTVKSLIENFNISERQLEKRFKSVVGMSPRLYIRVKRVNQALILMGDKSNQNKKLSDIAYELNYYDQSHFIRDVKAFSWVSPRQLTTKVSEFHSDIIGSSYL